MNAVDFPKFFNKCERKPKGQSRMDNPEKLATLGTQDPWLRPTKQITHHYPQTNINIVIIKKTWTILQTTGVTDQPNIVFIRKS